MFVALAAGCSGCVDDVLESDSEGGEVGALSQAATNAGKSLGTAVREPALVEDPTFRDVLLREFTQVTPENAMKWGPLAPTPSTYAWEDADTFVEFAEEHDLAIHGHTLVWDEQLPRWVNANMTAENLRAALRNHIQTTVTRYRGRIHRWDVVNEAVDAETASGFTESILWQRLGPDYIRDAFVWAHEADPDALLYYNEVGIERIGVKSDFTYRLLSDLLAAGVPIHGVGFQSHLSTHRYPSESNLRANIRRFADLGLRVHISELDARTLLQPGDDESRRDAQSLAFQQVVGSCALEPGCEGVTFWGFTDKHSWIVDDEPLEAPLLFDANYVPKPGYQGTLAGLSGRVPTLGPNLIENGDFTAGTAGWSVSAGELAIETAVDGAHACHLERPESTSTVLLEPLLDALMPGGPLAFSALVRLPQGEASVLSADLVVTHGTDTPVLSNLGAVTVSSSEWVELSGYFGLAFEAPPAAIALQLSGAPAGVDVCLKNVAIRRLTP